MEDGGWKMEDGRWRMEDRGWKMERRRTGIFLIPPFSTLHTLSSILYSLSSILHLQSSILYSLSSILHPPSSILYPQVQRPTISPALRHAPTAHKSARARRHPFW